MAQGKRIRIWKFVIFAAVAVCGAFIVGICVAKMVSNSEGNEANMQVAKWAVSANGDADELELTAGRDEQSFNLTVTNNSEVESSYVISVSNIPAGVKVGVDDGELREPNNGTVEFSNADYLLDMQENKTKTHLLKFAADLTDETVAIPGEDVAIDVRFTQRNPQL